MHHHTSPIITPTFATVRLSTRAGVSLLSGVALLGLVGCPPNDPPQDPVLAGYAVDCTPEKPDDDLLCVPKADWECEHKDYYVRESICARFYGGTPSEYDGLPKLAKIDPDGDGPKAPTADLNCYDLPKGVKSGNQNVSGCDDCRVCGNQADGYINVGQAQGYGWDEYPWCPIDSNELAAPGGLCNPDGGEPTTGQVEPTTGGEEPTDGQPGMGDPGVWICMGSWTISGVMTDSFGFETETVIPFANTGAPACVEATDQSSALDACIKLCEAENAVHVQDDINNDYQVWDPQFDCTILNGWTHEETSDPSVCMGGGPNHLTDAKPFTVEATLEIGDKMGTSDGMSGLVDFEVGECPRAGSCQVSLKDLRTWSQTVRGELNTTDGSSLPFEVTDVEVRLLQPALGVLDRSTGEVTFRDDMFASISTGSASLVGAPLTDGLDRAAFVIEGARGRLDGRQLTLHLEWASEGVRLSLRLLAR